MPEPPLLKWYAIIVRKAEDQEGGSLRDVQMLAGHSSLAVTQCYILGDGEARVKVVELA
ncbi:hypothetical protein [Lentibacter algarum]|uniref:hypothetical protein n=1 Tax=Lentibacter algarum TaxID=576131 RepID=UPI002490FB1A|nr:hypothetical protein [Lentibacter algarum]